MFFPRRWLRHRIHGFPRRNASGGIGVRRGSSELTSCSPSEERPYFRPDLSFWAIRLSPIGSVGRERTKEQPKRKREQPYLRALNGGALRLGRVRGKEKRAHGFQGEAGKKRNRMPRAQ